ncbi:transposase [Ancylostoma caninum]|uniref:Transposase n=1 Tax=Ancylostoma caninum TaxID=29170 RepID=A0A368H1C5_ANCCA|nr:transposase [Ancylostoma caninum]
MHRAVTGDELRIHLYDPQSQQQSREWRRPGSQRPVRSGMEPTTGKVLATIFWDADRILLIDYLEENVTITGHYYDELLFNLREAIKEKRRGEGSDIFQVHKLETW